MIQAKSTRVSLGALVVGLLAASSAQAQDAGSSVAAFYKGKQTTIIVGSSPGGGYDTYARLLARHRTENGGFERIARSACRHVGSRDGRTGPSRR